MKGYLSILMTILIYQCIYPCEVYYISNNGNDNNDGLTPLSAWKSLDKLQIEIHKMPKNSEICFERGSIFYGSLTIENDSIFLSDYGDLANPPVITGFQTIANWEKYSQNIFKTKVEGISSLNVVLVDGEFQNLGRYPNQGYLNIMNASKNNIFDRNLNENWTGGDIVIRQTRWVLDKFSIKKQEQKTLYFENTGSYTPKKGYGYFIQNHLNTLDKNNEWYFDGLYLYMFFENNNPYHYNIQIATLNNGLTLKGNNLTINNIIIQGFNQNGIFADNTINVDVNYCDISFIGKNAINATSSSYLNISNTTSETCNNNFIEGRWNANHATIKNCVIKNIGIFEGMGANGDGSYSGIYLIGNNSEIIENKISNIGYNGITFSGSKSICSYNNIKNTCMIKTDGASIYTYYYKLDSPPKQMQIFKNTIEFSGGADALGGINGEEDFSNGIYLDGYCNDVFVSENIVSQCHIGFYTNSVRGHKIINNIFFDNRKYQAAIRQWYREALPYSFEFNLNSLVSTQKSQLILSIHNPYFSINSNFIKLEENTYSYSFEDSLNLPFRIIDKKHPLGKEMNFANWKKLIDFEQQPTFLPSLLLIDNKIQNN
ncbi:right-handed parallel beta-helix repeat-containing protein [Formosa sp. S-31]|uniref:right-handed parallel beta-helix repeat-containing protein n=1 Tax=Formosa sp. S-31 TaxID=2790949 RepID=UPI003EB6C5DC